MPFPGVGDTGGGCLLAGNTVSSNLQILSLRYPRDSQVEKSGRRLSGLLYS